MIADAFAELETLVGTRRACTALGASPSTVYRKRRPPAPPRERRPPPPSARALSTTERTALLAVLCSERFCDASPSEVYATLLDEGRYLASERTMYRILNATLGAVIERRDQLTHPAYTRPELVATTPNSVWSWDISKLKGPATWTSYHLYVILDLYSRYVVAWTVQERESAELATALISQALTQQQISAGQLTIHADRGAAMRSKPVAFLLADLGVEKSHSRPYTSTDNPFSEAHFKTLKYRPAFPARFATLDDARVFCRAFFAWYNNHHHHSGIALMTPTSVHHGHAPALTTRRQGVLDAAYQRTPERFVRRAPRAPTLPAATWINKPLATPEAH